MNQKTLGIIIAVVVIIGAIAAFMMTRSTSGPAMMENHMNTMATGPSSLQELLTGGQSQTCTFTNDVASGKSTGTVYVAGGKVRGDFDITTSAQAQPMMSHMIMMDQTTYVWTSASNQGMKMVMKANANDTNQPASSPSSQGVDPSKKLDYHCSPWAADESKFTLPSDITFSDFNANAMMQMHGSTGDQAAPTNAPQTYKGNKCGACDSVPAGTARDQCKKSLGC